MTLWRGGGGGRLGPRPHFPSGKFFVTVRTIAFFDRNVEKEKNVNSSVEVEQDRLGVRYLTMPYTTDCHAHLRDDAVLLAVAPEIARHHKYVLVMPNLKPSIATAMQAAAYREKLLHRFAEVGLSTLPIMTVDHTDLLTPAAVETFKKFPFPIGVKSYPAEPGATTNSGQGVPLLSLENTLRAMEVNGVRLLVHGECVKDTRGNKLPDSEREGEFMREVFPRLREEYPNLLISLEHISTTEAVAAVKSDNSGNTVSTITPHHPMLPAEEAFSKSWANHARCRPYLQSEEHTLAVREFMLSGDKRAILGTDCAPHLSRSKEGAFVDATCGCYVPHALAMYVSMFAQADALDERLVSFACYNGPDWWGLPRPAAHEKVRLRRALEDDIPDPTDVPEEHDVIIPLGWTTDEDRLLVGMRTVLHF